MKKNIDREFLKLVYRKKPMKPEELRRKIPNIAKYLGVTKKELIEFFVELHIEVLNETRPLPGENSKKNEASR